CTVNLSDAQVSSGDIIVGNADGVVVVPHDRAEEIYELAAAIEQTEENIIADIENGISLCEARKRHGYHDLQKRSK
ncbi:MAG: RraA family protein, partial [Deltaproteobacteria bacterium]